MYAIVVRNRLVYVETTGVFLPGAFRMYRGDAALMTLRDCFFFILLSCLLVSRASCYHETPSVNPGAARLTSGCSGHASGCSGHVFSKSVFGSGIGLL